MEAGNDQDKQVIVYELWSDDDLRWIEIQAPTLELAAFLEAWCEKNSSIFRRRPWRAPREGTPWRNADHVAMATKSYISALEQNLS